MAGGTANLLDLIGLVYEAAGCPERWGECLEAVGDALDCPFRVLSIQSLRGEGRRYDFDLIQGVSESDAASLVAHYAAVNPFLPLLHGLARGGAWSGLGQDLLAAEHYRRSEFYNDWGRRNDVFWPCAMAVAHGPETGGLIFARDEGAPMGAAEERLAAQLLPHVKRTLRIHVAMEDLRARGRTAVAATDELDRPMLGVNGAGRIVLVNRRAEALLAKGDGLLVRDRRLASNEPGVSAALDALVRQAAETGAGRGAHAGGALRVPRRTGGPLLVSVLPFRSAHMLTEARPCAIVLIADPDAASASRPRLLAHLYGLTAAEGRVALMLADGLAPAAIATRLEVSVNTVKTHAKSVYAKTGARRQSRLARLVALLP